MTASEAKKLTLDTVDLEVVSKLMNNIRGAASAGKFEIITKLDDKVIKKYLQYLDFTIHYSTGDNVIISWAEAEVL
jgi:hypothetical protein